MKRIAFFLYGAINYLLFFGTFLYAIGFLGNIGVPKSIDSGISGPLGAAVLSNLGILSVFAVQHSVMARPGFKQWWTRFVPKPIERSTYVLLSNVAMWLIFWQWRPIGGVVWEAESALARGVLYALFFSGPAIVFYSTVLLDHFDLFGMRQVTLTARKQEYTDLPFATPGAYKAVRHPLYLGWFVTFWAAPTMTVGHLLFAGVCTAYILVAVQLEERDLIKHFGERYRSYRETTPMFFPSPKRSRAAVARQAS